MDFVDLFVGAEPEEEKPEESPVSHERPAWLGPPAGELGVAVPLQLVLARTDRSALAISHAMAFSSGITFELAAHVGGLTRQKTHLLFHEQHPGPIDGEDLPDGFLRFGVELPDGRRVSNLGGRRRLFAGATDPSPPVLIQHRGGGGQSGEDSVSWQVSFWLWPLPEPGRLSLYVEWPVAGIELSRADLETEQLLTAAGKATRLWSEPGTGAWTLSAGQSVMMQRIASREEPTAESAAVPVAELDALEAALANALRAVRRSRRSR